MKEAVRCERCGRQGLRDVECMAPVGWLWMQTKVEGTDDSVIAYACSRACRDGLWQEGPGPRGEPVVFAGFKTP